MRVPRVALLAGLAILALAVAAAVVYVVFPRVTPVGAAVDTLPASVLRAAYTDWTAVQTRAGGEDLTASSTEQAYDGFLDRAFDQDLTTLSTVAVSFPAFAENYGITPLDAEWEAFGQAREGAVAVLRLEEDVDLSALEERFADLGYDPPSDGPGSDGAWEGSAELVIGLDEPLTDVQQNVAVVRSDRLLLMSDDPAFLRSAVDVALGEEESLGSAPGVDELVDVAGEPLVASFWADDFACEDLAMSQADPSDVTAGEDLVEDAGGVHPLAGMVMAQRPGGIVDVGMVFDSDDDAAADLQPRTDLASGPAPGQYGTFPERFEVTSATAEGRVVTLRLQPVAGPLLRDLGQGPLLFATC